MFEHLTKETLGSWIIHHGWKVAQVHFGGAEFNAIDMAAKAPTLFARFGESQDAIISNEVVSAIAKGFGINPKTELIGLLTVLERRKLIEQSGSEISIVGFSPRGAVNQAANIFLEEEPSVFEQASISLAESMSHFLFPDWKQLKEFRTITESVTMTL